MKKLVGFLGILGLLLFAVQAQAVTLGIYDAGLLVPSVYHDGASVDTVVGITCQLDCTDHNATAKRVIHWTFFDIDSKHVTDGDLICTDDDLVPFSWKAAAGRGLDGKEGYLVFHATKSDFMIAGNAFLVDQAKKDAVFIPCIPLDAADFNGAPASEPDTITALANGIQAGTIVDMRYWIDPTYNAATTIVIWLVDPYVDSKKKAISITVNAWNDDEQRKSVTIQLPHELNKIIPCEIPGMPLDFVDGFITMTMPGSNAGFAYSYISSSLFGAQQTLLAAECEGRAAAPAQPCGCRGAGQ